MANSKYNLETKILEIATPLFLEEGYEKVDIRRIAQEAGIAVGTVYNYFPTKQILFSHVFANNWQTVFDKLEHICTSEKSVDKRLSMFIEEVYQALEERQGLGLELLKAGIAQNDNDSIVYEREQIRQVGLKLQNLLTQLLKETNIEQSYCNYLARALIFSMWGLLKEESEAKDKHLEFIDWLLDCLITKGRDNN